MADEEFEPDYDDGDFGGDDIDGEVHELDHQFIIHSITGKKIDKKFFLLS